MKLNLEQLEARLQAMIEVKLVSALPGFQVEDLVVHKLADAMKSNLVEDANGNKVAPNVFTLVVNPKSAERWQEPKLLEAMIGSLKAVGEEAGLQFSASPTISIVQKADQQEDQVDVVASHQLEAASETRGMTPAETDNAEPEEKSFPPNAFLIVDGVKVFPLTHPVINIGRRLDNHLSIDDPRISRGHAQLRAIKGRFVIFDLNSTGGTFVNAQRTSQSVLYPGDVISLAGVPLVFGQDNPPPRPDLADTDPLSRASADRPTAFLDRETGQFDRDTGELLDNDEENQQ
jgi:pSer/pThr/pTyr-binding forkhead associated (FHA) protein